MRGAVPGVQIDNVLVANPQLDLEGDVLTSLELRIAQHIDEQRLDALILDLSGLRVIDCTTAEALASMLRAVNALGAQVFLTGIRPAVASSLVMQGSDFRGVRSARDVDHALEMLAGNTER